MKFKLRREHTGLRLTWQGRLLITIAFLSTLAFLFFNLYRFLAPNQPVKSGIMVVEGWIYDTALEEAARLYKEGNYSFFACAGIPIEIGSYLREYETYAEMTAARLKQLGIPAKEILTCSATSAEKDRTYQSAIALKDTLKQNGITEKKLHLVTTGPHGRRSRMLFQKALGP